MDESNGSSSSSDALCGKHGNRRCAECEKCSKCPNDECLQEHPASQGIRAARALNTARRLKRARLAQSERPETRPAAENIEFNEAKLCTPLDQALGKLESEGQVQPNPISRVAEILGLQKVSARLMDRVGVFNEEQIANPRTLADLTHFLNSCLLSIAEKITDSPQTAADLVLMFHSASQKSTVDPAVAHLRTVADQFLRESDVTMSRMWFAMLADSFGPTELRKLFLESKARLLCDSVFMQSLKPRFYIRRHSIVDDLDDGTPDDDGSIAVDRVELSRERQLDLKVAWATSVTRRDRAADDLAAMREGKPLEPRWTKPRVLNGAVKETISTTSS